MFISIRKKSKKETKNKIIGLFPMAADLLHAGHIRALEEARKNCDHLIVALNCVPTGHNPTKQPPVQSVFERYWQLRAIKWVDEIIPYEDDADQLNAFACIDYHIRFLGSDYKDKSWPTKAMEETRGIKPFYTAREHHGFSTTELRKRVVENEKTRK